MMNLQTISLVFRVVFSASFESFRHLIAIMLVKRPSGTSECVSQTGIEAKGGDFDACRNKLGKSRTPLL